jgi:hypothetical protein
MPRSSDWTLRILEQDATAAGGIIIDASEGRKEAMTMRMEWLRADDSTPACWACFLVYPDKVSVLATLTNGLVDRDMTVDAARQLWVDLCQQGWRRVAEQELNACRMSHRRLREIAYQR